MKISAKTRYGLVCMISLAQVYDAKERVTLISLSEKLNFSKIYLEQVFSLLKQGGIVTSIKGAQGGYFLTRNPKEINVYDILSATEMALFAKNEKTVEDNAAYIEKTIQTAVFDKLDETIKAVLSNLSLADLVAQAEKNSTIDNLMYYL